MSKDETKYYNIHEVAELTGLTTVKIWYWDNEFNITKGRKTDKTRRFTEREVKIYKSLSNVWQSLNMKGRKLFLQGKLVDVIVNNYDQIKEYSHEF